MKKNENDWFKLEQLFEGVMALCLQVLMPKTNYLWVIDILLVTQAKLSFEKKKKWNKCLGNLTLFYIELGWYLKGKWPIKVLNTWYLGENSGVASGSLLIQIEGDFLT